MEQAGYITRRTRDGNQRRQHVFLTRMGRNLKRKLVPLAEEVNSVAMTGISQSDISTTRSSLLKMIENLASDEAASAAQGRVMPSTRARQNG